MEDFSTLLPARPARARGRPPRDRRSGFIRSRREGLFAESFMRSFIALNLSQFPETLIDPIVGTGRRFHGRDRGARGFFAVPPYAPFSSTRSAT